MMLMGVWTLTPMAAHSRLLKEHICRIQMLKIAFINEAVTLLEEADPQDYEAIISILLAYAGRRRTNAQ